MRHSSGTSVRSGVPFFVYLLQRRVEMIKDRSSNAIGDVILLLAESESIQSRRIVGVLAGMCRQISHVLNEPYSVTNLTEQLCGRLVLRPQLIVDRQPTHRCSDADQKFQ